MYGLNAFQLSEIKECIVNKQERIEDILSNIKRREGKLTLLYDLFALCYADDNYSLLEKQGMKNNCDILEIENSKLVGMEQVMLEHVELQKKVNRILER